VWAKSYLMPYVEESFNPAYLLLTRISQLFGEDEDSSTELDAAEKNGENGDIISYFIAHIS
jgi:hypothetical protein